MEVKVDSSILKRYVGAYKVKNVQIDLKVKEGKLYVHFRDQSDVYEFKPESETKFFFAPSPDAYQYEFEVDNKGKVVFGLASGRNRFITEQALAEYDLPKPDILICSAGSEIYYTDKFIPDKGWESHIDYQWKRNELQEALENFPGIYLQEDEAQWRFKLSYYVDENFDEDDMANLYKFLDDRKLRARVLLTDNKYLDLLPFRASKGSAVRYLSYKWKMPLEHFITAGNSGNDKDMLSGKTKAIVVANYSPELEELRKNKSIYFTKHPMAKGVLEGINFHTTAAGFNVDH